ncbi:hypothetical protein [Halopseudomonas sp.]|jgi:hypothetical protein|uniref:hypothetical protein n=1 Tax=Halopseudomonas sp. TaxID=2901191 RepID=UPI0030037EA1
MTTFNFEVELLQPVIISQQSATAGAHQSLDYLPGSLFLGLAASRLYAELPADQSWLLFHSGQVRFGDALPATNDQIAWPVPLCWHYLKGDSPIADGCFSADALFDPSELPAEADRQPVQLRGGYVCMDGVSVIPGRQYSMKTAIDRSNAMAAEGQLFGYQALEAGQRFRFSLSTDDGLDETVIQKLVTSLTGPARLGRSRSAQFGKARIRVLPDAGPAPTRGGRENHELVLWLLSDMQLLNQGQPALQPLPELLGLPTGSRWLPERSFLRARRYSVWNAWRRHHDPERQVISRGSVLRYQLATPLSEDQLAALEAGLGIHIEAGLGQVWVNPPMLLGPRPVFTAARETAAAQEIIFAAPDTPLIRRLQQRVAARAGDLNGQQHAERLFAGLCARVRDARIWQAVAPAQPLESAPGRSQWGRLRELSNGFRNRPAELLVALVDEGSGVLRERSGWQTAFGPDPEATLGNWLRTQLEQLLAQGVALDRVVGHLAVLGLQPVWQRCCEGRQGERT